MVKVKTIAFASLMMLAGQVMAGDKGGMNLAEEFNAAIPMAVIQWTCFIILLLVGYKMAWKPILDGLNTREDNIRESLDNAEKAKKELAELQETCSKMKAEAETEAKQIITTSRETATKLAKEIEEKAKGEADSVRANALKDIESAKVEALQSLRAESTELAISLAGKLISENLDNEKNRALTQTLIEKI